MPKLSTWDKIRLYGGAITGGSSSFVTGACIGILGGRLVQNPILKAIWYIGGASIGAVVGSKVEDLFADTVNNLEEAVVYAKEVRKVIKDAEELV